MSKALLHIANSVWN